MEFDYFSTSLVDFPDEIWRDVVGWDGIYQVSNFGRLKSLFRYDSRGRRVRERIKKKVLWTDKKRKNAIRLIKHLYQYEGRKEYRYLSRTVWESFNCEIPEGMEVLHMNGDVNDDRLENLKLGDTSDRFIKDYKNGKRPLHIAKFAKNGLGKHFIKCPITNQRIQI